MKSKKAPKRFEKQGNVLRPFSYVAIEKKIAPLKREIPVRPVSGKEYVRPLSLFHREDLSHNFEIAKLIEKEYLRNTLNHIHFMDGCLFVQLRHSKYDESVLLKARPGPCTGDKLICYFADENLTRIDLKNYQFHKSIFFSRILLCLTHLNVCQIYNI